MMAPTSNSGGGGPAGQIFREYKHLVIWKRNALHFPGNFNSIVFAIYACLLGNLSNQYQGSNTRVQPERNVG